MYGDPTPDFTGPGPDDPTHTVLYAVDDEDRYVAVVHANCCHADASRRLLRLGGLPR